MLALAMAFMAIVVTALPSASMIAVHKSPAILPCHTPFSCVKTYTATIPTPRKNQVLVKVAGSSVNPCEVDYLEDDLGCMGGGGSLGEDLAGTVVAVGADCTRLKVGDRVWADIGVMAPFNGNTGAMAQYAVVAEAQTGLAPANINLTEAGTIPLVGFTALEMWDKIWAAYGSGPKEKLTVVVTSGSGGTGFIALQLAKHVYKAATVVTATSGASNIAFVESLGADVVVDYKQAAIPSVNLP